MNYQISEAEHRSLELLRDQLDLVIGLLTIKDVELGAITSTSLFAFLEGRGDELARVLKAVLERHDLQRTMDAEQGAMQYFDWMYALRIVSGDALHTPNGSKERITHKLSRAAAIDTDMKHVLSTWRETLARASEQRRPKTALSMPPAKPHKRKKLTADT